MKPKRLFSVKFMLLLSVLGLTLGALLAHATVTGQSPLAAVGPVSVAVPSLAEKPLPLKGPGLGNLSYTADELFKPISWILRDEQGVPETFPGSKAHGLNMGLMHNGYFVTLFAPDSGGGPGGFLLYDVSNPRAIRLVKRIYEPKGRTAEFREAHAFGAATIGGRNYITIATTKGIEFWDFTDVNDIQQVKKLALPMPTVAQETLSAAALRGKQIFYNAADRRMSRDNYMSCASCHAAIALRGRDVFASAQCVSCHSGITFSDGLRHDVGTVQLSSGKGQGQPLAGIGFDTPTLYGSWSSSAYFHNGQAATLQDVFASGHGNTSSLPAADLKALAEYVRSLDASSDQGHRRLRQATCLDPL